MGSGFVGRHKRKSLLAAVLFIFQGRVKYVTILLLMVGASLPFAFSSETFGRMLEMPPIAAVLKMMGVGRVSTLSTKSYNEFIKSAMARAAADSAHDSYWNRMMGLVNPAMPCGSGCVSSLAMVKGAELYGSEEDGKDGKKKHRQTAPGAEGAEGANVVDLQGGPGVGNGLDGDTMAQNLVDRYSGGGAAPYLDRSQVSSPGSIADRQNGIYDNVMNMTVGRIPVPGRAQKVPAKMMGRTSGFSWKNGYKTKSATVEKKIGSKKPMFQLVETYSAGGAALKSKNSAYEYQAAYVGATYDGNDINLDIIKTDANSTVPPQGFVDPIESTATVADIGSGLGLPTPTTPTDVSPWIGLPQQAMALILESAALSIIGAVLVTVGMMLMSNPFTFAAGLAMWMAGIALCIMALMLALAAIMIGMAIIGFGQALLGSIYVIGGVFAAVAAIMAMTGIGLFVGVLWFAGIAAILSVIGAMAGGG